MRMNSLASGCSLLLLALGGCAKHQAQLSVRPLGAAAVAQPSGAEELVDAGRGFLADQRYGLAIGQFREALRFDPNSAPASNGLGVAYAAIGRADLARSYFERAIAFAPEQLSYRRNYERFLASAAPAKTDEPMALAEADAAAKPLMADAAPASPAYRLRLDLQEAPALTLPTAPALEAQKVEAPQIALTETGMTLVTKAAATPANALTPARKSGTELARNVMAAFTLEREPVRSTSIALMPSPSLQRISLYEVRIVSQQPRDALAQIMMRDFRAQWTTQQTATGMAIRTVPASQAFRTALDKARQRIASNGRDSAAPRVCAPIVSYPAVGTALRGSDRCRS